MRKKHWGKLLKITMAYLFLWSCGAGMNSWAAVSGHYTDLLPNPTSANGVTSGSLYFNGYDWQLATLPVTQSPGDAETRSPFTGYSVYVTSTVANTALVSTITALVGSTALGSTTFPAGWVSSGRSIRITARGRYTTTAAAVNWTWAVFLGTTAIVNTGAVAALPNQTNQYFDASAILTISTTGASGTVNGSYSITVSSAGTLGSAANVLAYSTATASAVPVDLTSQLTVNPTFTWGTASSGNSITFNNVVVEYLN